MENQSLITAHAIPITKDDRLYISFAVGGPGNYSITIRTLIELPNGLIVPGFEQHIASGGGQTTSKQIPLTLGKLLEVNVWTPDLNVARGQIFAEIILQRGLIFTIANTYQLTCGYIETSHAINYPLTPPESDSSGRGGSIILTPTNPAPGAELNAAFNGYTRAQITAMTFTLTTSAAVAVRTVNLLVSLSGITYLNVIARTTQIASLVRSYQVWTGPNLPADFGNIIYLPLPSDIDATGLAITTTTTNIQAADQFSAINLMTKQIIGFNQKT
jgi:hypothetical protein